MSEPKVPSKGENEGERPAGEEATGTAARPNELLDKDRESTETIPRKSSLT